MSANIVRTCGHTHVGSITIYWDRDKDSRVIDVIKILTVALKHHELRDIIEEAQETEGSLIIKFKPHFYYAGISEEERERRKKLIQELVSTITSELIGDYWTTFFEEPTK